MPEHVIKVSPVSSLSRRIIDELLITDSQEGSRRLANANWLANTQGFHTGPYRASAWTGSFLGWSAAESGILSHYRPRGCSQGLWCEFLDLKGAFTDAIEIEALTCSKWDDKYLSVVLTEHYPGNPQKPISILKIHEGSRCNAKKLYKSNKSSPLYSGPFDLDPYVSRQCQANSMATLKVLNSPNGCNFAGDPRTGPNLPHTSCAHGRQINPTRFSSMNASHLTANHMIHFAAKSDGHACNPNTQPLNIRFPQLKLGAPNENGVNEHRRNESSSSSATARSERNGPIIVKTPEDF